MKDELGKQQGTPKRQRYRDWVNIPGGFDALNTAHIYPSTNKWGIPDVPHVPLSAIPHWLSPYRTRLSEDQDPTTGALHFFLKDYQFESTWRRPVQTLKGIQNTWAVVLSPDFSLFYDCPIIMQMWNTYRSRWVARWWSDNGITVIPSVSWASPDSYTFCFLGLPSRSVLAVSTVGTRKDPAAKQPYLNGFQEMIDRLQPTAVLCFGDPYPEMPSMTTLKTYPSFWDSLGKARRKNQPDPDKAYDTDETISIDEIDIDV
ncbi:MAG: DUF4417 domain-containing protein [Chloroflexota bacterium]